MKISNVHDRNLRAKYYRRRKQIISGIPVEKISFPKSEISFMKTEMIKIVELYGNESRNNLIQNNRNLRLALHKRGVYYEDCFYVPLNRENGLNCLRGFYRLEKRISDDRVQSIVGECWDDKKREHSVVVVELIRGEIGLNDYIREKMLKDIIEGKYVGKKLVCSKGWSIGDRK